MLGTIGDDKAISTFVYGCIVNVLLCSCSCCGKINYLWVVVGTHCFVYDYSVYYVTVPIPT